MNPDRAPASAPPLEAQVVAEQVRGLYGRAALPLVTVVVNSSALAYVVYTPAARVRIGGWLAALFAVSMLRGGLIAAFRRASPAPIEAERWGWYFAAGSAANGILWGASAESFSTPPTRSFCRPSSCSCSGGCPRGPRRRRRRSSRPSGVHRTGPGAHHGATAPRGRPSARRAGRDGRPLRRGDVSESPSPEDGDSSTPCTCASRTPPSSLISTGPARG